MKEEQNNLFKKIVITKEKLDIIIRQLIDTKVINGEIGVIAPAMLASSIDFHVEFTGKENTAKMFLMAAGEMLKDSSYLEGRMAQLKAKEAFDLLDQVENGENT